MSETHIPPVPSAFRDSIEKSAQSLPTLKEEPKTLIQDPVQAPVEKPIARVLDNNDSLDNSETIVQAELPPVIEAVGKIKNEEAAKAEDVIVNEVKVDDFEFDDDTKNYLRDVYKEEASTPEEIKSDKKPSRSKEEIDEQYKPYIEKAAEYDSIINDPMTKAWIEFRKNGGTNPSDFIKHTGIIDVKAMTPEQLIEIDMKNTGLTADEMTEELERFKEMTPYAQKKATKSIQDELERQNDEKLKTFAGQSIESDKFVREAITRGTQELNTVLPKMEGKKYKGLLITADMLNSIKNDVVNNPVPRHDEKGTFIGFNIEESIRRSVILNFDEQRSKALIEIGKTMGADKALKSRIRPDKKEASSALIPTAQQSLEDIGKSVAQDLWKKRGVKPKL